jgi:transcriptional regulator with XRE-family HTH domain
MPSIIHKVDNVWRVYGPWGFRPYPAARSQSQFYAALREELQMPTTATDTDVVMALTDLSWDGQRWVDDVVFRLKQLRSAAGLTQAALAEKAGMSVQAIASLEQGARLPGFATVRKLAEALGVGVYSFVYLSEAELARLPWWARVAFSVRCVHTAFAAAPDFWPGTQPKIAHTLRRVVELARRSAAAAAADPGLEEALCEAAPFVNASAGIAQGRAPGAPPAEVPRSDQIRYAVANACEAAGRAALDGNVRQASEAYSYAQMACLAVGGHENDLVAMLHDYEALRLAASREGWNDATPVPSQAPPGS